MICSYTQTYGNNRSELFDYHNKDNTDIIFRNKLDKTYLVFHNSSSDYISNICQYKFYKKIKNIINITYNNISYTLSFMNTLLKIKNNGIKYVVFLQDDVFSLVDEIIIDELLLFVKNNSFDMLNLECPNININAPIIYSNNNLIIYNTTSNDFINKDLWSFDDGPYIANIDFLLNKLYDNIYLSKSDIWSAEKYLANKVNHNPIQRLSTNISIYKRIGIIGPNADRYKNINELNNIFFK